MNLDNFNNSGKKIEAKLNEIRKRIEAPLLDEYDGVDIIITEKYLRDYAIKNKNKPIFIRGKFCMTYIKDHYIYDEDTHNNQVKEHPNHCFVNGNKVHFYCCRTLISMTKQGRNARYRSTSKIENTRTIDLGDKENLETRLALCQNCIHLLHKQEKKNRFSYKAKEIAEYSDAKELMDRVKKHPSSIQIMVQFVKGLKGVSLPTRYPPYWREISNKYRERHKYTCEFCDVNCSDYPKLTDAHHINGDKNDCDDKNLECLCKYHHAELHPHYKKAIEKEDPEILKKLEELWDKQGIPPYKPGVKSRPINRK